MFSLALTTEKLVQSVLFVCSGIFVHDDFKCCNWIWDEILRVSRFCARMNVHFEYSHL